MLPQQLLRYGCVIVQRIAYAPSQSHTAQRTRHTSVALSESLNKNNMTMLPFIRGAAHLQNDIYIIYLSTLASNRAAA